MNYFQQIFKNKWVLGARFPGQGKEIKRLDIGELTSTDFQVEEADLSADKICPTPLFSVFQAFSARAGNA
jgi:hypothetical protein